MHVLTCSKKNTEQSTSASFFNVWRELKAASSPNPDSETIEKVVVASQPLLDTSQSDEQASQSDEQASQFNLEITPTPTQSSDTTQRPPKATQGDNSKEPCPHCNKMYKSRGLNKHIRSCSKKTESLGSQPSRATIPTNNNNTQNPNTEANQEVDLNPRAVWGNHTYDDLTMITSAIYEEVVKWKKNLFKLPSGGAGKRYIRELTRLIEIWNSDSLPMSNIALKLSMIMPATLLQKPSRKSTSKQHGEYLTKRLVLWENGQFDEIMKEAREIQHALSRPKTKHETTDHKAKVFAKLMLQGKVHAAFYVYLMKRKR